MGGGCFMRRRRGRGSGRELLFVRLDRALFGVLEAHYVYEEVVRFGAWIVCARVLVVL